MLLLVVDFNSVLYANEGQLSRIDCENSVDMIVGGRRMEKNCLAPVPRMTKKWLLCSTAH